MGPRADLDSMYVAWNKTCSSCKLTCICLMAGVPTEMTFKTASTVKLCRSVIIMTSQRDNTKCHDNALPVTCHSRCASHRTMHMSYRSKTYTWNDVILVKRSMIFSRHSYICVLYMPGKQTTLIYFEVINPLNPELNPICYLLALLRAHHFLHVSRIRVTSLALRLLMSYIYGAPILDVSRSHTTTQHSR